MAARTFRLVWSEIGYESPPQSYFRARTPGAAARKYGTRLFKLRNTPPYDAVRGDPTTIKLVLQETTRGSSKPRVFYRVKRVPLDEPVARTFPNGRVVTITHKIVAKRCDPHTSSNCKLKKKN